MPAPARYKLQLTKLDFLSLVDHPAQGTANIRLVKRAGAEVDSMEATLTARVLKVSDGADPLLYCWAFTTVDKGVPYHDLQGDAISDNWVKVAEEFIKQGGPVDELHDSTPKSRIAFAYPMDSQIATAMLGPEAGAAVKTAGLMVAIRPTPEQLAKVRSGEFNGVSIAGTGIRELIKAAPVACPSCGTYGKADAKTCKDCGAAMKRAPRPAGIAPVGKAVWSAADMDSLPDSSFLYIEGGGTKDSESKTTPRSLRHFPYKDATGKVDLDHLRNAISRIPQSSLPKDLRDKLQVRAEKLLAAQHETSKRFSKQAVLTGSVDGHAHSLDLDDPADEWRDQLSTSYQTAEGATQSHSHAWTYDPTTGSITIAEDSGHTHPIDAVVPADVRAQAAMQEDGERCRSCGMMAEEGCRFCPNCGKAMGPDQNNGIPVPMADDDDSDANSGPNIVIISARAPNGGSIVKAVYADCGHEMKDGKLDCPMCAKKRATPRDSTHGIATPTTSHKEQAMATEQDNQIAALRKQLAAALALTEPERLHIAKQSPAGIEAFLAMDSAARTVAMTAADAADPEVYKTKDGLSIRKSAGQAAVAMAKQLDAQAEQLAAASEKIAKAEAQAAQVTLEKRAATELSHFAKSVGVGAAIVKALDGIADETTRKAAFEAVKGANFALAKLGIPAGADDHAGPQPDDPNGQLEALAKKHATDNKVSYAQAYDAVLLTPEGTALYKRASTPTTLRAV